MNEQMFSTTYALDINKSQNTKEYELLSEERYTHLIQKDTIESSIEEVMIREQYPRTKVVATGYTAGVESTGKTPDHPEYGVTFSGVEVRRDKYSTIAADLSVFPLGTILYIPDYGYGVVADKGSAITGNKIDLYYETVEDVYAEWGKRTVEVYLVEVGQGSLTTEQLSQLNKSDTIKVFQDHVLKEIN